MVRPPRVVEDSLRLSRGELLDRILLLEDRLRILVESVLSRERTDWESLVPQEVRDRLRGLVETAARNREGPNRTSGLLAFATLGDLSSIVAGRWKHFADTLGDKTIVMAKLTELRLYRNALAHGMYPSDEDKVKVALLVQDLEQRIPLIYRRPARALAKPKETSLWVGDKSMSGSVIVRAAWIPQLLRELEQTLLDAGLVLSRAGKRNERQLAVSDRGRVFARIEIGQATVTVSPRKGHGGIRTYYSPDLDSIAGTIRDLAGGADV